MKSAKWLLPGHPDKLCDLVAAAVALEYAKLDDKSVTDIAVSGGKGALFVSGETVTQVDFNAVQTVKQTLGSYGFFSDIEVFADIEPVKSERVSFMRLHVREPFMALGYACRETEEMLPEKTVAAIKIAKAIENKRINDENWYWLSSSGCVEVNDKACSIMVAHGSVELSSVQDMLSDLVDELDLGIKIVRVNTAGAMEKWGLESAIGRSGADLQIYGAGLPNLRNGTGRQIWSAEFRANWQARKIAKMLMSLTDARAVMVKAWYQASEVEPYALEIRDERGRELSQTVDMAMFKLDTEFGYKPEDAIEWLKWGAMGDIHFA